MGRWLVLFGLVLVILGIAWPWLAKLGLGRLPGDLRFGRGNTRVYVPLATSLLISIVLTILLNLFLRR